MIELILMLLPRMLLENWTLNSYFYPRTEKSGDTFFSLLKGIIIGGKRGKTYGGPFRGFLIKPVLGEILFLGSQDFEDKLRGVGYKGA